MKCPICEGELIFKDDVIFTRENGLTLLFEKK